MTTIRTSRLAKAALSLTIAGVLGASLAACGSSSSSASSGGSSSSSSGQVKPIATLTNLTGTSTQVKLFPAFLAALTSLKVTPGVVDPTTLDSSTGVLTFPITGGNATYYAPGSRTPYVESNITHSGGITLSAGGTTVKLTNFVVDAGTSKLMADVSVNGGAAMSGVYLFFLDGRTLKQLDTTSMPGSAILQGTTVKISPDAAALLNKTFGTTAIADYTPVGVATITLKLPS